MSAAIVSEVALSPEVCAFSNRIGFLNTGAQDHAFTVRPRPRRVFGRRP
jgi:hypothetical protein